MQAKLWSLNALSVELDIDRRTLARRIEDLPPDAVNKTGRNKTWKLARVVRYLAPNIARGPGRAPTDSGELDLNTERARLAKEQADKAELDNQVRRGELVEVDLVGAAVGRMIDDARARLLAIPSTVAPLVHSTATPAEAQDLIKRSIYDALAELSADPFENASAGG